MCPEILEWEISEYEELLVETLGQLRTSETTLWEAHREKKHLKEHPSDVLWYTGEILQGVLGAL